MFSDERYVFPAFTLTRKSPILGLSELIAYLIINLSFLVLIVYYFIFMQVQNLFLTVELFNFLALLFLLLFQDWLRKL